MSWGSLIAPQAGLRYFIHPKCASSTLRWWMWKSFNATTIWNEIRKHRDLRTFTSIREPISRFVSGYNEVSFHQLQHLHCDEEVRRLKTHGWPNPESPKQIFFRKSVNEAISTLYEEDFVNPYGVHIALQSIKLEGIAPLDFVLRSEFLVEDMRKHNIPRGVEFAHGRTATVHKLNASQLSDEEIRKLCWILRKDYCTLKDFYDKPEVCTDLFDCSDYRPNFLKDTADDM